MKIDWLSGKNIQSYINELKVKMGVNNGFRSKSQEKAQNLIDKNTIINQQQNLNN
jgi:hypothetical protein